MQLTATEATCPLCKHPVGANGVHSDPTRLCEDCQRIVQTIRSTGNARIGVIEPPQLRATLQSHVATSVQGARLPTSPVLAEEDSDAFEEETPIYEPHPLGFNTPADAEPSLFDFDALFDDEPSGNTAAQEAPSYHLSGPSHGEGVLQASTAAADPIPEPALQSSSTARAGAETPVAMSTFADAIQDLSDEIAGSQPGSDPQVGFESNGQPAREFFEGEVVTSPLEEPAQWNYAQTDFPILVGDANRSKLAKLRLPIVAALLVCCGVAGYFVIYRPSIQPSQSGQRLEQVQPFQPTPISAEQYAASQARPQASVETKESGTPPSADHKNSQSDSAAKENREGRYSLQAAAFPNEAGANEFCERLKRAGVPAYVVSAEIAGRGKWFRVRVGKFESAQDADRFGSEARLRARASGLNLQLIVSSYDKP
jgi:cell division septation protein DedD